eukprot:Seg2598.4 transcript_id=Seg2598.4/GoldUCD/mRNA.D3Y31 product="Microtubule-actin cross-linking factor 1" protein_id=Seg2598.4/GoldUCD/D3Y31
MADNKRNSARSKTKLTADSARSRTKLSADSAKSRTRLPVDSAKSKTKLLADSAKSKTKLPAIKRADNGTKGGIHIPVQSDDEDQLDTLDGPVSETLPMDDGSISSMLATTLSENDEFNEWMSEAESKLEDDVTSFKIFNLQAITEKKNTLEFGLYSYVFLVKLKFWVDRNFIEDRKFWIKTRPKNELYEQIETRDVLTLSENFQRYCQMIPPSEERIAKKVMIRDTRSRMMRLRLKVVEQHEILRLVVPMLCLYNEDMLQIKQWLDNAELQSKAFINKFNNDNVLLENAHLVEDLLGDMLEQRSTYETFLTAGETSLDFAMQPFEGLRADMERTAKRWDNLSTKLEKCLERLEVLEEQGLDHRNQRNKFLRIDRQIRRESRNCSCKKHFQIIRIAKGKYIFGDTKLIRLVRIHGASVVVRVGGGWEFLYEFLMRCDPCRAKQFLEDAPETLKKMGITPIDDSPNSYSFDARRFFSGRLSVSKSSPLKVIKLSGETGYGNRHACNDKTPTTSKSREGLLRKKMPDSSMSTKLSMSKSAPSLTRRPKSAPPTCERRKNLKDTAVFTKKTPGFK